jgi:hypothetical protein
MKMKDFGLRFLVVFGISLLASVLATVAWNYLVKGIGFVADWQTSFRIAIVLAVVIPLAHAKRRSGKTTGDR